MEYTIDKHIDAVLSDAGGVCIELLHTPADPSVWKVRISRKFLWFRLKKKTSWFLSRDQALTYAAQSWIERSAHYPARKE